MALPAASIFKLLHRPLHKLQLVWREEVAAASCAGADIVAWWRKLRRPPEEFKDLDKMGAATIDLAPLPIDPVDKVVWEPMKALNQLDGAAGDFIMEDDSDDAPPSHNSPSSTGSRTSPPLCSPLSIHQLRTVPKKISNDERQGNDAMGVQGGGADADGAR